MLRTSLKRVLGRGYSLVDGLDAFFHAFLATTVTLVGVPAVSPAKASWILVRIAKLEWA